MSCTTTRVSTALLSAGLLGVTVMSAAPPASAAGTAPAALSIQSSALRTTAGNVLTLAGQLTSAGAPKPGATVLLLARTGGTDLVRTDRTLTTDASGRVAISFRPRLSTEYRFQFNGDALTAPVRSVGSINLIVPLVGAAANRASAATGDPVTIAGSVKPALGSAALALQHRVSNGPWKVVVNARTDARGGYVFRLGATGEGPTAYRVVLKSHAAYSGAYSRALPITVAATLRSGDKGPRVVALQNRLTALKYDLGKVDGSFGGNTLHALTAFQKGQGLPRTGTYDKRTREALAAPKALRVRYPAAGRAVEVDLAKQILIMSEGGRITKVLDVSTGNNAYYYSDGVRYLANTPIGRFRVTRKIDGVRTARLGKLYRPAYFVQGWAIHGSPSVPTYPASHGCVRVTNATMDRIFGLLTVGTPIAIYPR